MVEYAKLEITSTKILTSHGHVGYSYFNEIALGLCDIHTKNVIHGDIHSSNVFVYDSKKPARVMIADLGLSRSILRSSFR